MRIERRALALRDPNSVPLATGIKWFQRESLRRRHGLAAVLRGRGGRSGISGTGAERRLYYKMWDGWRQTYNMLWLRCAARCRSAAAEAPPGRLLAPARACWCASGAVGPRIESDHDPRGPGPPADRRCGRVPGPAARPAPPPYPPDL